MEDSYASSYKDIIQVWQVAESLLKRAFHEETTQDTTKMASAV
jgi:hypothetical protein